MCSSPSPSPRVVQRKLTASEFQSTNEAHLKLVRNMGITIVTLPDGRVQLLHTHANARCLLLLPLVSLLLLTVLSQESR